MIQPLLNRISEQPALWNGLRYLVEAGFHGEKDVIARELDPWRDVGQRRFLDFGCGTGEFAACFPPQAYVGVDVALRYVTYAGQARTGSYLVSDGVALALEPAAFDAALVLGVFHHLPDDTVRAAVTELQRVLRPQATLLVIEDIPPPDGRNLPGQAMHWLDRGGHIRSDADYRRLLTPAFAMQHTYTMRSGICDYAVYVLRRGA